MLIQRTDRRSILRDRDVEKVSRATTLLGKSSIFTSRQKASVNCRDRTPLAPLQPSADCRHATDVRVFETLAPPVSHAPVMCLHTAVISECLEPGYLCDLTADKTYDQLACQRTRTAPYIIARSAAAHRLGGLKKHGPLPPPPSSRLDRRPLYNHETRNRRRNKPNGRLNPMASQRGGNQKYVKTFATYLRTTFASFKSVFSAHYLPTVCS